VSRLRRYGFILVLPVILVLPARAQVTADSTFAEYLLAHGEYFRAITEFYRVLVGSDDARTRERAVERIALCYYLGDDAENAARFLGENRRAVYADMTGGAGIELLYALSLMRLGRYEDALRGLQGMDVAVGDSLYDEKYTALAKTYAMLNDVPRAMESIGHVTKNDGCLKVRERFVANSEALASGPPRSPLTTGLLAAVVPGSGYLYCGQPATGVTSFVVNGLLIWSLVDAVKNHQYGLGLSIGFFGAGWYAGNITGSVTAAHEYNALWKSRILDGEGN
jgi:hypothetical protein